MKTASEQLRERIDPQWPESVRKVSLAAIAAFDAHAGMRATLDPSKADFVAAYRREAIPIGKAVAKVRNDLAAAHDRHDAAYDTLFTSAFGKDHAQGSEVRSYLRSLPAAERAALLTSESADPRAQLSAMAAPEWLSGIDSEVRQRIADAYLSKHHGKLLDAWTAEGAGLTHAEACLSLIEDVVHREGRFVGLHEFEKWLAATPADPPPPAPDPAIADRERLAAVDKRLAELTA